MRFANHDVRLSSAGDPGLISVLCNLHAMTDKELSWNTLMEVADQLTREDSTAKSVYLKCWECLHQEGGVDVMSRMLHHCDRVDSPGSEDLMGHQIDGDDETGSPLDVSSWHCPRHSALVLAILFWGHVTPRSGRVRHTKITNSEAFNNLLWVDSFLDVS